VDGFKAFKYFVALKLHFTSEKYDVFETNGRVNGSRESFDKRNDRLLFEKLAKKFSTDRELIQYIAANIAYGNKNVVYSSESEEYYDTWVKRKESISRVFQMDLNTIQKELENANKSKDWIYSIESGAPLLLNLYVGGYITLETMVILEELEGYLSKWEPLIMLWHDHFLTIHKSKRFVKFDRNRVQSIYENFIGQLACEEV
jgi:hypothetical protein